MLNKFPLVTEKAAFGYRSRDIRPELMQKMGFPGGSDGKESACSAGDPGLIPGSERLPKACQPTPSILAWEIPWTEKPGGLQSLGCPWVSSLRLCSGHSNDLKSVSRAWF